MYLLKNITPTGGGDRVVLQLVGNNEQALLTVDPADLRRFELKKGCEVSEETYDRIVRSAEHEKAIRQGLLILGYGTNSASRLSEKLIHRGFSSTVAEKAVAELTERGYIDEEKDVRRLCDSMISKKYGPRKILTALRGKGYGRRMLGLAEEFLGETDFSVVCEGLIRAKVKKAPENRDEMKKLVAKLSSFGYNMGDIKSALCRVFNEI